MGIIQAVDYKQQLWPVRPRPLPDELLSSWLIHLAKGNGQKLQPFCDCAFGKNHQLWNRDIDRLAPRWLLQNLSAHTNVAYERIRELTLLSYKGRLFPQRQLAGQLRWILPLKIYHRKRLGFGLQFCAQCLGEDKEPYFRKRWRVALYTFCTKHGVLLEDRCPKCQSPVAFHRRELGRPMVLDARLICACAECNFDLRHTRMRQIPILEQQSFERMRALLAELEPSGEIHSVRYLRPSFTDVLHQFCKLLASSRPNLYLRDFVLGEIQATCVPLRQGRFPLEERSIEERHCLIQLATWITLDLRNRIEAAWQSGAIRYNHLQKDMLNPPRRLTTVTSRLNRCNPQHTSREHPLMLVEHFGP